MPINACSINTYSVDTICFSKRAKYIDILWGAVPPIPTPITTGRGGGTSWISRHSDHEETRIDPRTLEHLYITLTTKFYGEVIVNSWDNSPTQIRPLISINKLKSMDSDITVEVHNLRNTGKE
jgi:hypothetical protein